MPIARSFLKRELCSYIGPPSSPVLAADPTCSFNQYIPSAVFTIDAIIAGSPPITVAECSPSGGGETLEANNVRTSIVEGGSRVELELDLGTDPVPDTYSCIVSNDVGTATVECQAIGK